MPTSDVERQRKSQEGKRAKIQEIIDAHLADVNVFTEVRNGKQFVTFDMSEETNQALNEIAKAKGTTLDDILRGVIAKNLRDWAKFKLMKEARERKEKIATIKGEMRRLKAERAEMEKLLTEYRAGRSEGEE